MMMQTKKDSRIKRFYRSRLFLFLALIVVGLVALGYARAYYQGYKIRQEIESLQQEIKTLETKKIESFHVLDYVVSPQFVEDKARTELNLKKPGENVLVIKQTGENEEESNVPTDEVQPSNPARWWYYFFGNKVDNESKKK